MTSEELRALDEEIHRKVMGEVCVRLFRPSTQKWDWYDFDDEDHNPDWSGVEPIPAYSSDIAAAWLLVEELRRRMPYAFVELIAMTGKRGEEKYSARVAGMDDEFTINGAHFYEPTAPHAICRAALKALEETR